MGNESSLPGNLPSHMGNEYSLIGNLPSHMGITFRTWEKINFP
jgi:hypothetical protein